MNKIKIFLSLVSLVFFLNAQAQTIEDIMITGKGIKENNVYIDSMSELNKHSLFDKIKKLDTQYYGLSYNVGEHIDNLGKSILFFDHNGEKREYTLIHHEIFNTSEFLSFYQSGNSRLSLYGDLKMPLNLDGDIIENDKVSLVMIRDDKGYVYNAYREIEEKIKEDSK